MKRIIYILIFTLLVGSNEEPINDYFGGWPTNLNKDQIISSYPDLNCEGDRKEALCGCVSDDDCYSEFCFKSPKVGRYCMQGKGTVMPEFLLKDQFGEEVNIYDFAGHGKLIVIELSASWCRPCKQLADWLSNDILDITSSRWWKKEYSIIKNLIAQKQIYFINVLLQDIYKDPASIEAAEDWFQQYSDENIPILADEDYIVRDWARSTGYPTVIVLNDKMEVVQFSIRGWQDSFDYIVNLDWPNK